jgi:excisionase family DNA binding protein
MEGNIINKLKNKKMKKQFLDIEGISEYLSISKSNLYKKVAENKIPFHKVGSRTLFDIDEINLWVRSDGTISTESGLNFDDIKKYLD